MAFRINRVYTRSGDDGSTSIIGGERLPKSHYRLEAVGSLDELNCLLGVIREKLSPPAQRLAPLLEFLQQELFDLGSEVATPRSGVHDGMWQADSEHVAGLESLCDHYGQGLPELHSFILPGGSELASYIHVARAVCRRAERAIVALNEQGGEDSVSPEVLSYINRFSDLLFNLARWTLRAEGKEPVLWSKGEKRQPPE